LGDFNFDILLTVFDGFHVFFVSIFFVGGWYLIKIDDIFLERGNFIKKTPGKLCPKE